VVSYSREDQSRVEMLVHALEAHQLTVWWDRSIEHNADWGNTIQREIARAAAVVVCWSDAAARSRWVAEEAEAALQGDKYVGCIISAGAPGFGFGRLNCVNLLGWEGAGDSMVLLKLLEPIGRALDREDLAVIAQAKQCEIDRAAEQERVKREAEIAKLGAQRALESERQRARQEADTLRRSERALRWLWLSPLLAMGAGVLGRPLFEPLGTGWAMQAWSFNSPSRFAIAYYLVWILMCVLTFIVVWSQGEVERPNMKVVFYWGSLAGLALINKIIGLVPIVLILIVITTFLGFEAQP